MPPVSPLSKAWTTPVPPCGAGTVALARSCCAGRSGQRGDLRRPVGRGPRHRRARPARPDRPRAARLLAVGRPRGGGLHPAPQRARARAARHGLRRRLHRRQLASPSPSTTAAGTGRCTTTQAHWPSALSSWLPRLVTCRRWRWSGCRRRCRRALAISEPMLVLTLLPHALLARGAAPPLAAWIAASRRDAWHEPLAATAAHVRAGGRAGARRFGLRRCVYVWPQVLRAASPVVWIAVRPRIFYSGGSATDPGDRDEETPWQARSRTSPTPTSRPRSSRARPRCRRLLGAGAGRAASSPPCSRTSTANATTCASSSSTSMRTSRPPRPSTSYRSRR